MTANDSVRAHCLTAPGMGGVAVVQVIGARAPALVSPCLRSRRDLDLESLAPDQIRLCEFVEEDEVIDDVLVCARRTRAKDTHYSSNLRDAESSEPTTGSVGHFFDSAGSKHKANEWVIDLNFHGGPRIVERVLMLLQKRGVQILPWGHDALQHSHARDFIELEAMQLLPIIQTRPVAQWILRVKDRLPAAIQECEQMIAEGRFEASRARLNEMISFLPQSERLMEGARIVVCGRPNSGKSTLVNALAQREHILVSDIPGTTRDYVEQPAAIEGVPVLLVDTAGIRETPDPLEQEAIRRGQKQLAKADLVLDLVDVTAQPDDREHFFDSKGTKQSPRLIVWTKVDQLMHSQVKAKLAHIGEPALQISATSGQGLGDLRAAILEALNLADWQNRGEVVFSARQRKLLSRAIAALASPPTDTGSKALSLLKITRLGEHLEDDASPSGGL